MKKVISIIVTIIVLVGIAILFAVRWNAWFAMPAEPQWNGETIDYHFYCFGEDSVPGFVKTDAEQPCWHDTLEPDTLHIILFGDIHNGITHSQLESIASRHPKIDCYAQLGDFFERCYPYYMQLTYREFSGTRFESLPILSTPGNHEYTKGWSKRLSSAWTSTFKHPSNGYKGAEGKTYYVDFQNLRFIAIDTNGFNQLSDLTRVNTWLKQAIKEAGDRFVIVMMHHPIRSQAKGRYNPILFPTFFKAIRGADVIFTGHDHLYARHKNVINTNASLKHYNAKHGQKTLHEPVYEVITVTNESLQVETCLFRDGSVYDSVKYTKQNSPVDKVTAKNHQ